MEEITFLQRLAKPSDRLGFFPEKLSGQMIKYYPAPLQKQLSKMFRLEDMEYPEYEKKLIPNFFKAIIKEITQSGVPYVKHTVSFAGKTTFIICRANDLLDIVESIRLMVFAHEDSPVFRVTNIGWAYGRMDWRTEKCPTVGWVQPENQFMFFIDQNMFIEMSKMLSLT